LHGNSELKRFARGRVKRVRCHKGNCVRLGKCPAVRDIINGEVTATQLPS
jgi:hypothetical protein